MKLHEQARELLEANTPKPKFPKVKIIAGSSKIAAIVKELSDDSEGEGFDKLIEAADFSLGIYGEEVRGIERLDEFHDVLQFAAKAIHAQRPIVEVVESDNVFFFIGTPSEVLAKLNPLVAKV